MRAPGVNRLSGRMSLLLAWLGSEGSGVRSLPPMAAKPGSDSWKQVIQVFEAAWMPPCSAVSMRAEYQPAPSPGSAVHLAACAASAAAFVNGPGRTWKTSRTSVLPPSPRATSVSRRTLPGPGVEEFFSVLGSIRPADAGFSEPSVAKLSWKKSNDSIVRFGATDEPKTPSRMLSNHGVVLVTPLQGTPNGSPSQRSMTPTPSCNCSAVAAITPE